MTFAVGSLIHARGREWVVLPDSTVDTLTVRPLGGTDDEVTGIYLPLERDDVRSASFSLPNSERLGDHRSCRLLRDAVRLGFRSSAGPFRSFANLAVEPRPYQLVPLLLALKLDPVRLLIADDVGIGKTVEALLVARELLDRGEVKRLAVLCPPHLAEQWQTELRTKFHIEAELVLSSTATRLEKNCGVGESLFEVYPYVVVSTEFIKSDRRREDFLRTCPELVIVDEAHACATDGLARGGRHQRYELLKGLAAKEERHVILVTATPHSGNESAFRSLLGLLRKDFLSLPPDLTGPTNEGHRRELARHLVQRRRGDILHFLKEDTVFPQRLPAEDTYTLHPEYRKLFEKVLAYARETVADAEDGTHRQRVRWWAALGLLRALASSPAAAAASLRSRAAVADTETIADADAIGRSTILDLEIDEAAERLDVSPGGKVEDSDESGTGRRLRELAKVADELQGQKDQKLEKITGMVKQLLDEGFHPILFCRFIATADYVAAHLRQKLKGVEVISVTGTLPPAEREDRVEQLTKNPKRILVATDCLSEGINLQKGFSAVIHYDLAWNPTRHEQREGRVDRYGQPAKTVRVLTYYGADNQIDGIVLEVLLRKHEAIRSSLGISVPVPTDSNAVVEAIFEGLLLRGKTSASDQLSLFAEAIAPEKKRLFDTWDAAIDREKRSRTMFAQESIKTDEVARELEGARRVIGSSDDVARFLKDALEAHQGVVSEKRVAGTRKVFDLDLKVCPAPVREAVRDQLQLRACFELPEPDGAVYLHRTHPVVENLASYVFTSALDPLIDSVATRTGVIETDVVQKRTTLLLLRLRFHILTKRGGEETPLLAEDCQLAAFAGAPAKAEWLVSETAEALLDAQPTANVTPDRAKEYLEKVLNPDAMTLLMPTLETLARKRGEELLDAHRRVREASKAKGVSYRVEPVLPPDVLGVFVLLPVTN